MKVKLVKVGNSRGVILPKSILDEQGTKLGATMNISYKADLGHVTIEFPRKYTRTQPVIDREVYAVGNDLLKRYLPAFKKLARA